MEDISNTLSIKCQKLSLNKKSSILIKTFAAMLFNRGNRLLYVQHLGPEFVTDGIFNYLRYIIVPFYPITEELNGIL